MNLRDRHFKANPVDDINTAIDQMIADIVNSLQEEADLPEASPLDLLSKKEYEKMSTYLKKKYGPLLAYIDENYVALLLKLQQYESIDLNAKILEHIAANIKAV